MSKRFYIFAAWLTMLACSMLSGTAMAAAPWNANLLVNPSCDNSDYAGWTKTDKGSGWGINTADSRICWASSYQLCSMEQTVNLPDSGFTAIELDAQPFLVLGGSYCCPWSRGSLVGKAKIIAYILDESGDILQTVTLTDITYKANDIPWTAVIQKIQLPVGSRSVKFYFAGKDSKSWTGQYGSRFDDMWLSLSEDGITPSNAVSCTTVANGSFSVDKTTANYGDTVKITVTSDAGYGLKQLSVTTSNGAAVTVASDSTFIMPAGYAVTVSGEFLDTEGLSVSCATVANGAFSVDKTTANYGDTVRITVTPDAGYGLKQFNVTTSNGDAVTVASNSTFIMPAGYDVTVSGEFWQGYSVSDSIFFEGFESGYTHDASVANSWVQQSEVGEQVWTANKTYTDHNCTPRSGSFNATLRYSNTDWLFTPVYLTAGDTYDFEMYARQDKGLTSDANITVMLGQGWPNKDNMTYTLVFTTGLTYGDYQRLSATYTATESGIFVLGIKGYMNGNPFYISIDDITFAKCETHNIGCATVANGSFSVDKTTADAGDTVKITVTPAAGYDLKLFNVTTSNGAVVAVAGDSTFIMPAGYDVTVSGEFWEAIPTEVGTDGLTYYLISNEAELTLFGSRINAGYTTFNGKLTADIALTEAWTPMGTSTYPYAGTFDGNGYRIANLNVNIAANGAGLFGVAGNGAKFKNIIIAGGTIQTSGQFAGGIVGYTPADKEGTISFDRCANYAAVYSSGTNTSANAAGIYGCNGNANFTVTMTNCYNVGAIGNASRNTSQQENGGLSGFLGKKEASVLSNCYNVGVVFGSAANNSVIIRGSAFSASNSFYLNTLAGDENRDRFTGATQAAFVSGEVAYLLGEAYGQNLGTDTVPVFRNDTNQVFKVLLVVGENTDSVYSNRNFTVPAVSAGYQWIGCNVGNVLVITQDTILTAQLIGTGLSDMERTSLVLYPNPARDYVTVSGLSTSENAENLQVYDLFGRLVLSQKRSGLTTETLDISALADGIYQVRAGSQVVKLIKK